jgi:hypothetical protein
VVPPVVQNQPVELVQIVDLLVGIVHDLGAPLIQLADDPLLPLSEKAPSPFEPILQNPLPRELPINPRLPNLERYLLTLLLRVVQFQLELRLLVPLLREQA